MMMASTEVSKFENAVGKSAKSTAAKSAQMKQALGKAALGIGALMVAGFALAINAAAQFDKQMSATGAAAGATGKQMDSLRAQAIQMGADTKFSAIEAAQGQEELVKAGVSVQDVLGGGLQGALALAAAGELDVGQAATIASQAMVTFGLSGKDVPAIADALAAGANKSAAEVGDLASGLAQAGLVASQYGLSMQETVGTLAAFSAAGLQGSDAGTSLKTMLTRLGAPTGEAADLMERLGLSVYDSTGAMLPFEEIAGNLQHALSGMSDEQRNAAMNTIFGADAIRAANVLFREGEAGISGWTAAVSEQGYAAGLAAEKADNLSGDLEQLGGSIETLLIKFGSAGQGPLRVVVQTLTELLNMITALPAPVQTAVVVIGALAAVALLVGGATATLGPKLTAANAALAEMGTSGALASKGLSLASRALGVLAVGMLAIQGLNLLLDKLFSTARSGKEIETLSQQLDQFGTSLNHAISGSFKEDMDQLTGAMHRITEPSLGDQIMDVGNNILTLGGAISDTGTDLSDAKQDVSDFNDALVKLSESDPQAAGQAYAQVLRTMISEGVPAREAMDQLREAREAIFAAGAPAGSGETADAIETVGDAADAAQDRVDEFKNALTVLFFGVLDLPAAADAVAQAINDITQQMIENGGAIRGNSNEALANRDALREVASAQVDYISALKESGAPQAELTSATNASILQLQGLAQQFPQLQPVIDTYIAQLQGIPREVESTVSARDQSGPVVSNAQARLNAWNDSRGVATLDANNDNARIRIQASKDRLFDWDHSYGTGRVNADNRNATGRINIARGDLAAWGTSSGTGTINARDNASGVIDRVAQRLASLNGASSTVTINQRTRIFTEVAPGVRPVGGPARWGAIVEDGVIHAQSGHSWQAGIMHSPTIFAGERETGGEAFIPRLGNRARSLGILEEAASWYGARLVPQGVVAPVMSAGGGNTGMSIRMGDVHVRVAPTLGMDTAALRREVASDLRRELNNSTKDLLVQLRSR